MQYKFPIREAEKHLLCFSRRVNRETETRSYVSIRVSETVTREAEKRFVGWMAEKTFVGGWSMPKNVRRWEKTKSKPKKRFVGGDSSHGELVLPNKLFLSFIVLTKIA